MKSGVTVKNSIADPFHPASWDRKLLHCLLGASSALTILTLRHENF